MANFYYNNGDSTWYSDENFTVTADISTLTAGDAVFGSLDYGTFDNINFTNVDISNITSAAYAYFYNCDFSNNSFPAIDIQNSTFSLCTLVSTDFSSIIENGFAYWLDTCYAAGMILPTWMTQAPLVAYSDCSNVDFSNVTNFSYQDFSGVNFSGAIFAETVDASSANFTLAIFSDTTVMPSSFDVQGATFSSTDFNGVSGFDYSGFVNMNAAIFQDVPSWSYAVLPSDISGMTFLPGYLDSGLLTTRLDLRNVTNMDYCIFVNLEEPFLPTSISITGATFEWNYDYPFLDILFDAGGIQSMDAVGFVWQKTYPPIDSINFSSANSITNCYIERMNFSGLTLAQNTNVSGTNFNEVIFDEAVLPADLSMAIITGCSLVDVNLSGCLLPATMVGCNFSNSLMPSNLSGIDFTGSNFTGATLSGVTDMTNANFYASTIQGTLLPSSLSGANFSYVSFGQEMSIVFGLTPITDISNCDFSYSSFDQTDFRNITNASGAIFTNTTFTDVIYPLNAYFNGVYYVGSEETTLDENGNGTWNGQTYLAGILQIVLDYTVRIFGNVKFYGSVKFA